MFQEPKNKPWQPSASIETLKIRARILKSIRDFFDARGILEVETPLLCSTSVTDPYIQSIPAFSHHYLQTSPEYAMKRLLSAGSGSIYQISKAFRMNETGRYHNPEFTILEWYRLDFDHHALMNDMDDLLRLVLNTAPAKRISYQTAFEACLNLDPHTVTIDQLQACAHHHDISIAEDIHDRDTWLQILMSECIEPQIGQDCPCFIYDFPASQAALSRLKPGNPTLASRFEVYYQGIELANGFHELQDADEQRKRFEKNRADRNELQLPPMEIDTLFLEALAHGLPDCAGVALGIDRLIMLATHKTQLSDVLSFNFNRV